MKRSFFLVCLISLLLIFVSSMSFAETQTFTRLTVDVPAGWTASETQQNQNVNLINQNDNTRVRIIAGNKNGLTLRETGQQIANQLNGTGFGSQDGMCGFNFTNNGTDWIARVFDEDTPKYTKLTPNIASGWYCFVAYTQVTNDVATIINSLVVAGGNGNNGGNGANSQLGSSGGGGCNAVNGTLMSIFALLSLAVLKRK